MPHGGRITTGRLYRLIPNWRSHWDYDPSHLGGGKPKQKAFRKDSNEDGLSLLLAGRISIPAIMETLRSLPNVPQPAEFGVVEFEAQQLLRPPELPQDVYRPKKKPLIREVYIEERHDDIWGDAHVVMMGVTGRISEWMYQIGKQNVVRPPGQETPEYINASGEVGPAAAEERSGSSSE